MGRHPNHGALWEVGEHEQNRELYLYVPMYA